MFKRLAKWFHSETSGLTAAAVIIGASALAADIVGVLRDRSLAATFGAGNYLDAYYAAFRVPDFLYNLVIVGSLSAGFIPVFAQYLETRDKKEAWHMAEQVLSVVGVTMIVLCLVLALTAQWIVPLTVPGFSPEKTQLTIQLARIMFLSPFFLGLSAVMGGILQATRRFIAFSIAPVAYNLGIIFGTLVLVPRMGVIGVAWGVVLGAFLHCLIQTVVAIQLGIRRIPWPSIKNEGVRRILKLMGPRTLGLAVSQLNLVILLIFASTLSAGSVAIFNLANNLQGFPVSIIGISFAVAAFPILSKAAGKKDIAGFKQALSSAARKICFFILPMTALFFLLRAQIVRLALGAGVFGWTDTIRTAVVLGVFVTSLIGQSLVPLLARAFYALQDTWAPLWIGLAAEIVNAGLAYFLRVPFGIAGLVVAFSVSTYLNMFLLLWMLRRREGKLGNGEFTKSFLKSLAASVAIIAVGYPVRQFLGTVFPLSTFWQVALQAAAAGAAGTLAFVLVAWLIKSEEFNELIHEINYRMFKRHAVVEGAEEAQNL
ncbi:MAG: murein biosynthesis integral membrane protein MurJ [Patescibacteria group bacterium]